MTTIDKPYFPNTEELADENGKVYKYVYEGKGFFNKRSLHEAMVREFITEDANKQLDDCIEGALIKLDSLYPDDTESQLLSKANVGFFNRTTSTVHYDLEQLAKEINEGDSIQVIVFNMPFGQVSALTYFALNTKELNEKGSTIIGAKISDNPLEDDSEKLPPVEQPIQTLKGRITTDPLA